MKITEWRDKKTWNDFVAGNSQPASFLQSWEWGEFQKSLGYDVARVGFQPAGTRDRITDGLIAVASVIKRKLPFTKKSVFYVPRGPVIRKDNHGSREVIIKHLVSHLSVDEGTFVRLNLPWAKTQDSLHWKDNGFIEPKLLLHQREPHKTFITEVKENDEMQKLMHQKTRYNIRLAEKKKVVFEGFSDQIDFEECFSLLSETAKRQHIKGYTKEYYLSLLHRSTSESIDKSPGMKSYTGIVQHENDSLACGIWIGFGDTLTYLYGGSTRIKKELMAPYMLHSKALLWAHQNGYKNYDWWGLAEQKESSLSGVTRFKKGFGGYEHQFSGTYDFIVNKASYNKLLLFKRLQSLTS